MSSSATSPHSRDLVIGCFASICTDRLGEDLIGFSRAHPDVTLGVQEMARAALLPALRKGGIGLAIGPADADTGLPSLPLWQARIAVALSPSHPLASRKSLTAQDLNGLRFLVSRHDHCADLHRFLISRVTDDDRPLHSDLRDCDTEPLLDLVASGAGAALVCDGMAATRDRRLVRMALDTPNACFPVCAYWLPTADPAAVSLVEALRNGIPKADFREQG